MWAKETGGTVGDLDIFEYLKHIVPVSLEMLSGLAEERVWHTFGDDLMARISLEISSVTHSIFLLGT